MKLKLGLALMLECIFILGQSDIANILPPTPQTFNFSVQNTNFVNTPSGEFTYELPVYQVKANGFSLPVSLTYRSGVKVDDQGGNVGTSWQLNAGGVVSRVVKDMPDELAPKRWIPENIDILGDASKIKEAAIPGEYVDTEYDWFNFNVSNGFSGNFYLDSDLNPIYSGNDYKISKTQNTMSDGKKYYEFIITDKLGNQYFFGGQKKYVEETVIMTSNNAGNNGPNPKPRSATGWFLYKIKTAVGTNILLDYETDTYDFFSSVDSSLSVDQKCACSGGNGLQYNTSFVDYKTLSSVTGTRLISISTDTENLYFTYGKTRNDVSGSISALLTSIELKNKSDHTVKNYSLTYDEYFKPVSSYYFTSSNLNTRYRYFLNGVIELNSGEKHQFEYYQPENLPARFSLSTDYYGYFNNKTNTKPFPSINDFNSVEIRQFLDIIRNKIPANYISANKEVDPATVHYGNIKKIVYPTGGSSTILYEPNKTVEALPVDNYSTTNFEVSRQCDQASIIEEKKTITSNGTDIFLEAEAYTDYSNCGEPDHIHEVYGMSIKDLVTGNVIWSKNRKVSDGSYSTDLSKCNSSNPEYCPIKTIAGRDYEISFRVSSKIGEILGFLNVKYNKTTSFVNKDIYYAGSRVQKIIENNNEGASYSKNYFYNYYNEKNSQKTKISFYIQPRFFYIKAGLKNCYFDCGCYDLPIGADRTICMGNVDSGSGAVLNSVSVGYTVNSLFNSFNNRSNKPFYSVITEEIEGKSVVERIYNEYNDTPSLTFSGPEIYNLPYSNTSNLFQGKIKSENLYEYKNSSYSKIATNIYDYDYSKNFMLKTFVYRQNYPIPPYFAAPNSYIDNISIAEYYNHYGESKMTQLNKEEVINSNSLYTITTNQYANQNHYQLTTQKTTYPDGSSQNVDYSYASEKGNTYLQSKNMVGVPLLTQTSKTVNGVTKTVSKSETVYPDSEQQAKERIINNVDNKDYPLPRNVLNYDLDNLNSSSLDLNYDFYDNKGNILQYTTKDGISTAIVWGYDQTQPIAKIEGAKYSDVSGYISTIVSKSDADGSNGTANSEQQLLDELDLFRNKPELSAFQITTYTYDPLIGVRSITPPSGVRQVYIYDTSNRLKEIREHNATGNLLKGYQYNYKH
ncbi:hypothetical protein J2X97_001574 [Epilithonimonas hungarica]|uniref:hypothetical protein n=1 Tax=Epilithonimonas hungarica TaxID=454006 RepID=UPI0027879913|nr:hypothetical protein [Epilithonimonas hungarica]MDP9955937.1 hypothetical protein [Epilithonimonas hungarica]